MRSQIRVLRKAVRLASSLHRIPIRMLIPEIVSPTRRPFRAVTLFPLGFLLMRVRGRLVVRLRTVMLVPLM